MKLKQRNDSKAFKLLDLCKNEGRDDDKWTFEFEDLIVQNVSVFAVHWYIEDNSNLSFRDWLLDKEWVKKNKELRWQKNIGHMNT